jgi:hypothetical protein
MASIGSQSLLKKVAMCGKLNINKNADKFFKVEL